MLFFTCNCGVELRAPDEMAGKAGKCPICKAMVTPPLPVVKPHSYCEICEARMHPADASASYICNKCKKDKHSVSDYPRTINKRWAETVGRPVLHESEVLGGAPIHDNHD